MCTITRSQQFMNIFDEIQSDAGLNKLKLLYNFAAGKPIILEDVFYKANPKIALSHSSTTAYM